MKVDATTPYHWPYDGVIDPARTALVVCGADEGWAARTPSDPQRLACLERLRAGLAGVGVLEVLVHHDDPTGRPFVPPADPVGSAVAALPGSAVPGSAIFSATSSPSLSASSTAASSSPSSSATSSPASPVTSSITSPPGSSPVSAPDPGSTSVTVRAAGIDGFYGSDLDPVLRRLGRSHLLLVGLGLETTVHSTMRRANDRGYECLLVADAALAIDDRLRPASISSIEMSGGIFGAVGATDPVLAAYGAAS